MPMLASRPGAQVTAGVVALAAVAAVAASYADAPPWTVAVALATFSLLAWVLDRTAGAAAYVMALGVQVAQSLTLLRVALADFLILPVIVKSAGDVLLKRARLPRTTLGAPFAALLAVMAAATAIGYVRHGTISTYVLFNKDAGVVFLVLASLALAMQLRSTADVVRLVNLFVVAGSVTNALALGGVALSMTVLPNPLYLSNQRMYGWLLNPSNWAGYVAMIAALELPRLADGRPGSWKVLRGANFALLLLSVGLTVSRSAWLSLAGSAVVLLALLAVRRIQGQRVRLAPAVAATVTAVAFMIPLGWVAIVQWTSLLTVQSAPSEAAGELRARLSDSCAITWRPELCARVPDDQVRVARQRLVDAAQCARAWEPSCSVFSEGDLASAEIRLRSAARNCVSGPAPRECLDQLPAAALDAARAELERVAATPEQAPVPDRGSSSADRAPRPGLLALRDGAMLNARGLEDRAAILAVAWRDYTASPATLALGIGLGTFLATSAADFGVPLIIHNTPLWFLIEMGPAGLLVLLWIASVAGRNLWVTMQAEDATGDVATGLLLALAFWSSYALFNEGFYLRHFWLVLLAADQLYVHRKRLAPASPGSVIAG
ncbi:MAG: hypothetical protein AB7K63_01690 [Vicinamibacterales bacterium]